MNSKTFCAAPWVHASVNALQQLTPCCASQQQSGMHFDQFDQWWNGHNMVQLRQDLATGKQNTDCEKCWQAEQQGRNSLRQNYNSLFRSHLDYSTLRQPHNTTFDNVKNPVTWELDIGSLCNLKCIMCNPLLSDKIQQEVENNALTFKSYPLLIEQAQNTTDKNWLDSPNGQEFLNIVRPNLKWLKLQGGEALTVKSIRYLIESLDHEQTVLFITTNGTVLDKKLLQAFSKIKKVQVAISIEAAGPANDVIRYGSNWETVSNNIRTLLELPNVELQLNHVLQATSALFLPSVVEFAENVNTHVAILPLNQHKYLALEAVPTPVLQKMIDTIQRMDIKHSKNQYIKNFVSTVTSTVEFNKTIHTQFKDYISTLDSVRDHKLYPFCKEIINYEILTVNLL